MRGPQERNVSSLDELFATAQDVQVKTITVTEDLADVPSLRLSPGQALRGDNRTPA